MKNIMVFLFIGVITISTTFTGCIESDGDSGAPWVWYFQADIWANVTFTSTQLTCAGSNAPEDIFAKATNILGYEVWVFQEQSGELVSWWSEREINELEHILPHVLCHINIDHDYTLIINRC